MATSTWSRVWTVFASIADLPFAIAGLILSLLLIIWWRQQSSAWFRVAVSTFLAAVVLAILSFYLFVMPPYSAGCPDGCPGWRGYPLRMARVEVDGTSIVGIADFALNVLILWLLWLAATVVWRIMATALEWEARSTRVRALFVFFLVVLPWALMPRILNPPQLQVSGEDQRMANNALRAAEFTYGITGLWVQRLGLEDVRRSGTLEAAPLSEGDVAPNQVCLRGYTYFFLPWQRYVVGLDASGATALELTERTLGDPCWN